jgi:hypothetical protein
MPKKTQKATKKTKTVKPSKTVPLPKPKNISVIEVIPSAIPQTKKCHYDILSTRKVAFVDMANVLYALSEAFLPEDADPKTEPSDRFAGAWQACLALGLWDEEEFWTAHESEDPCPMCGGEIELEKSETKKEVKTPPPKDDKKLLN